MERTYSSTSPRFSQPASRAFRKARPCSSRSSKARKVCKQTTFSSCKLNLALHPGHLAEGGDVCGLCHLRAGEEGFWPNGYVYSVAGNWGYRLIRPG